MKPARIKWGLLGGGSGSLIGIVHRIAAEMGDDYRLVGGAFSANHAASIEFARTLELDPRRAYANVDALIAGESALPPEDCMRLVTIATPNYLHYEEAAQLFFGPPAPSRHTSSRWVSFGTYRFCGASKLCGVAVVETESTAEPLFSLHRAG